MTKKIHFQSFDALRFFAFLVVFLSHLPLPIRVSGGIGVQFFFVLSGFLITYLLLHEKKTLGTIQFKKFFIRRVLKIFPLYYAMLLFAFLTPYLLARFNIHASADGYEPNWWYSCLFLENYNMMFTGAFPNVSPLGVMWSLCIEEHFYICWGILLTILPIRMMPTLITVSILLGSVSRAIYAQIGLNDLDLPTHLDYFASGAALAYLLLQRPELLQPLNTVNQRIRFIFILTTILYIFASPQLHYFGKSTIEPILFCICFTLLLGFTLPSPHQLRISDDHFLSKLGIYTYGLYLYHIIVINALLQVFNKCSISLLSTFNTFVFSIIALSLTIGISIISYHLFEQPFLKLKKYFR